MITRYILVYWNLQMVLILIFQRIACVTSPLIPATDSTTSSRSWNIVVCINPVKMLFDKFSEKYGASKVRFSLSVLQLFTRALRYVLTDKRNNDLSKRRRNSAFHSLPFDGVSRSLQSCDTSSHWGRGRIRSTLDYKRDYCNSCLSVWTVNAFLYTPTLITILI